LQNESQSTEDLIFSDIHPESLDQKSLKDTYKTLTKKLEQGDRITDYLMFRQQILTFQDKFTGAAVIHQACEFDKEYFLAKILRF
jgi:hypothetical protein